MIGLETALSVVAESMVKTGLMDWSTLVQRMSTTPAAIAGYSEHGSISLGGIANFIVVDPESSWKVDRAQTFSRSSNTPFHGFTLPVSVIHTFYRGIHVLRNGQLSGMKYE